MTPAGKILGLTIGIVDERDDPKKWGRVKLILPAFQNRKTDWSRVLVPFGGKTDDGKHGQLWIPEEKDEVLCGFYAGDPKVVIVLGALYSEKNTPPTENVNERVMFTPKGNRITMSDDPDDLKIRIETKKKQFILFQESDESITIQNKHKIILAADGKSVTIQSEGGMKITLDDTQKTTTIEAPTVVVKATSVQLTT